MVKTRFSTVTRPVGAGSETALSIGGTTETSFFRRRCAARADTNAFQAPSPCSTGPSARPRMIEAAIMPPPVSWFCVTR